MKLSVIKKGTTKISWNFCVDSRTYAEVFKLPATYFTSIVHVLTIPDVVFLTRNDTGIISTNICNAKIDVIC